MLPACSTRRENTCRTIWVALSRLGFLHWPNAVSNPLHLGEMAIGLSANEGNVSQPLILLSAQSFYAVSWNIKPPRRPSR